MDLFFGNFGGVITWILVCPCLKLLKTHHGPLLSSSILKTPRYLKIKICTKCNGSCMHISKV